MYQMDNEKFGCVYRRTSARKAFNPKGVGRKLFISDKAVSKWERGLSIPNVSMLIPLAEILGVTVTELLRGERLEAAGTLNRDEVEKLVTCSVDMSMKEQGTQRRLRKQWSGIYVFTLCAAAAELIMFRGLGFTWEEMADSVLPYVGMLLLFGGWFAFLRRKPFHLSMIRIKLILSPTVFFE